MTPEDFQRLEALFHAASELPEAQREEFVARELPSPSELRDRLRHLLIHDQRPNSMIGRPMVDMNAIIAGADGLTDGLAAAIPDHIGGYRIRALLGRGGMGIVYAAEQLNPRRDVALKVLAAEMPSQSMLRRFEREIEVLGRLQHPAIARIYEAGIDSERGSKPYFAMEWVRGVPIVAHARDRSLNVRARLSLLARVCEAVHYAHQHGVLHRDLKPANILVDEFGQPKILDFGIARITDFDRHAATQATEVGILLGTLDYMSPEQVSSRPDELDARADVYSLGAIGYELLTGHTPNDLRGKSVAKAARLILEQEPRSLRSFDASLRGDLETILNKALEKEKEQRYPSAEALQMDLERHLHDEPILARRATTMYQVSKFARRHRGLVGGLLFAFLASIFFGIISLYFAVDSRRSEREAEWSAGTANLALAEQAIRGYLTVEARERLERVPQVLRGWAWDHLHSRLDRSVRTFRGHLGPVSSAVWHPSKNLVASGAEDRTIRLWDASTGDTVAVLQGHKALVGRMAFDPRGELLASPGSHDQTVRLWDVIEMREIAVLRDHHAYLHEVEWSRDGEWLLTCAAEPRVLRWNRHGELLQSWDSGGPRVMNLEISPDGTRVLVGTDSEITVRDVNTWEAFHHLPVARDSVNMAAWHPSGSWLALGTDSGSIRAWAPSATTLDAIGSVERGVIDVEFSLDGSLLFVSTKDPAVRVFDWEQRRLVTVLLGHEHHVDQLNVSGDGSKLVTASFDGTARIWDSRCSDVDTLKVDSMVHELRFSPDGKFLAAAGSDPDTVVRIFEVASRNLIATLRGHSTDFRIAALAVSPGSEFVASGGGDGQLILWSAYDWKAKWKLAIGQPISGVAFHPGQRFMACNYPGPASNRTLNVAIEDRGWVDVIDVETGRTFRTIDLIDERGIELAFSPDGKLLCVGTFEGAVVMIDTRSWTVSGAIQSDAGLIEWIAFGKDPNLVATAGHDTLLRLWDLSERRIVARLKGHSMTARSVDFSPDGKYLASTSSDQTLRIWDVDRCDEIVALDGHESQAIAVGWSPDGHTIATSSWDFTIRLWTDGKE